MALTFYYGSGSPFAWKVWLALEHKGIPYQQQMMSFDARDMRKPEFLAINPRGRVPAIVDDGFALYESAAIVEYLEDRYREVGPSLWPAEVQLRARARRMAIEADGYLQPAIERILEQTFFRREGDPDVAVIDAAKADLVRELKLLALGDSDFAVGAIPTAADFTIYPSLAQIRRIDQRFPRYEIAEALDARTASYMDVVEELPYFARTVPPHWRTPG